MSPEDASGYLYSADICIQIFQDGVSFRRGSFLAPLSHGVPIITTKLNALPDGLEEYRNVLAAPVGDVEGLANSVRELISSRRLRERIGRNGRTLAKNFSWEAAADQHVKLYRTLLEKA